MSETKSHRRLLFPYDKYTSYGPRLYKKLNRYYIYLNLNNITVSSVSYARYLMSVKVGRLLDGDNENVDHIDDDKTHDMICNLQIINRSENSKKNIKYISATLAKITCPMCSSIFHKQYKDVIFYLKPGKTRVFCCSKQCSNAYLSRLNKGLVTVDEIKQLNIVEKIVTAIDKVEYKHTIEDFIKYSVES